MKIDGIGREHNHYFRSLSKLRVIGITAVGCNPVYEAQVNLHFRKGFIY